MTKEEKESLIELIASYGNAECCYGLNTNHPGYSAMFKLLAKERLAQIEVKIEAL